MDLRTRLLPAALVAAAAPGLAAPFCIVTPEGFHFQNVRGSLKLVCLSTGENLMTWAFQGHALAVCTDQTARVKVVVQSPGQSAIRGLDLRKGPDAAETEWQALAKAFLGSVQKTQPESEAGFRILMAGMMQAMDAEVGAVEARSGGDEKRAMRIAQYWSVTEPTLGLGELAELLAFMRDYRELRKDTPNFFGAPRLGGLLRGSAGKLLPAAGGACLPLDRLIRRLDWPFNPEAPDAERPDSSARPAPGPKPAGAAEAIPIAAAPAAETKAAEPGMHTPRRHQRPGPDPGRPDGHARAGSLAETPDGSGTGGSPGVPGFAGAHGVRGGPVPGQGVRHRNGARGGEQRPVGAARSAAGAGSLAGLKTFPSRDGLWLVGGCTGMEADEEDRPAWRSTCSFPGDEGGGAIGVFDGTSARGHPDRPAALRGRQSGPLRAVNGMAAIASGAKAPLGRGGGCQQRSPAVRGSVKGGFG